MTELNLPGRASLPLLVSFVLCASAGPAGASGGKPFSSPSAALSRGPVAFSCREVAAGPLAGGINLLRFRLAFGHHPLPQLPGGPVGTVPDPAEIVVLDPQFGTQSYHPPGPPERSFHDVAAELFRSAHGTVLFAGTKHERVDFLTEYRGAPYDNHFGPEWRETLVIQQDLASGLVFAKYVSVHVVDHGESCRADWQKCEPRERVIMNQTYLCEPE